ncbi:MAG: hypothetical protein QXN36_08280 [Candidatus Bathyarchaeia archaeon]
MIEYPRSETAKLILPFSALSENRKEEFTKEMEKTAIFCFAELERAKGGGLILKQPAEKIAFISEFCYPFWLIPWSKLNLLFDGLSNTAYTLTYNAIPDVKAFTENIERSSKTLETYMASLVDNINYFQIPEGAKEIAINGLISDPSFLSEFASYLNEANQVETSLSDLTMLSPTLEESSILSSLQELENLKTTFKEEIDALYGSIKLLNNTTRNFTKTIRAKIKTIKDEFNREIKKQEAIVKPKVDRINEEYNEKIAKLAKDIEKQLLPLQKEKVKFEKTKEQTLNRIERYKLEAKTRAASKDAVGERKWKEKISETKKELSDIESKIKDVGKRIKEVEDTRSIETIRLKSEWEAKIKEAKKDLLELEASRDSKIQFHKQEIEKLEKTTATIIEQINKMAKMRETGLAGFEKLGIEQKHKQNTIIYVPLYLVCYTSEKGKRFVIFPPSIVNSISFLTKLKGVLGRAKIKQLLAPRFKSLSSHFYRLPALIERNAVFEREISEKGSRTDILKAESAREEILNNLKSLKNEGWLSEKEHETLVEVISKAYA